MKKKEIFTLMILISYMLLFGCKSSTIVKKEKPKLTYKEVAYEKLSNVAFMDEYIGKRVKFKTQFLGIISDNMSLTAFKMAGIDIGGEVFMNHGDATSLSLETKSPYSGPNTSLVLSIKRKRSDILFNSKHGDIFEIKGLVEKIKNLPMGIHIKVHTIQKLTRKEKK